MSWQMVKFVLEAPGLTPSEKAVATVFAYHAKADGTEAYPSMNTVAYMAGYSDPRSARDVVRDLEKKGILLPTLKSKGGRPRCGSRTGNTATSHYAFNLNYGKDNTSENPERAIRVKEEKTRSVRRNNPEDMTQQPGAYAPTNSTEQSKNNSELLSDSHDQMEGEVSYSPAQLNEALESVIEHYREATGIDRENFPSIKSEGRLVVLEEAIAMRNGNLGEAVELMMAVIDKAVAQQERKGEAPPSWFYCFKNRDTFRGWAVEVCEELDRKKLLAWKPEPSPEDKHESAMLNTAIRAANLLHPEDQFMERLQAQARIREYLEANPEELETVGGMSKAELEEILTDVPF